MTNNFKRCGIYSFPKSGNTWMREIVRGLYEHTGDTNDVVPDVYQRGVNGLVLTSNDSQKWSFYKSHSAKELKVHAGNEIQNDLVVYIIRNPFDVFCSQLNYLLRGFSRDRGGIQLHSSSIDDAKADGLLPEYFSSFLVFGTLMPFFRDAKSWMENAEYWINRRNAGDNVVVIKYEDMVDDLEAAMGPMLSKIGMPESSLEKAIAAANARTNDGGKFFWKKKAGTYKEYLKESDVLKFQEHYSGIMQLSGYKDLI